MATRFRARFHRFAQCVHPGYHEALAVAAIGAGAVASNALARADTGNKREPSRVWQFAKQLWGSEANATDLKEHHLSSWQEGGTGMVDEPKVNRFKNPMLDIWPHMHFQRHDEQVLGQTVLNDSLLQERQLPASMIQKSFLRANAYQQIWWDPSKVKVGIVTCGGLCPGLNSIIREVTRCLVHEYGVHEIYGFQGGWNGLSDVETYAPVPLDLKAVRAIHKDGGCILKAGRGGLLPDKICDNLEQLGINMLFVVGGDGTQWAGDVVYQAARERGLALSVVGIPKSIDNDVLFFDRTFGFDTAVRTGATCIDNAWVEAQSCHRGVGIVKLMGRDAGFVAVNASLASTVADCCLIPEVKFKMEDLVNYVNKVVDRKDHCVVVVAEGAGQDLISTGEKDSTGHTKYGDIGTYLRDKLNASLKASGGRTFYIEPSYIIRSVPITPIDHIYCLRLSHDAVHTAMRGYTGVCVGAISNIVAMVPSKFIAAGTRRVLTHGQTWQSCVHSCKMPENLTGLEEVQAPQVPKKRGSPADFRK
mmetsp:Transcript_21238/g.49226  ORF Transcript_21238/g.49226 Transcript_21238/m.49226 type:complete len:532 (+) Transcript_21238:79-1674(+)